MVDALRVEGVPKKISHFYMFGPGNALKLMYYCLCNSLYMYIGQSNGAAELEQNHIELPNNTYDYIF